MRRLFLAVLLFSTQVLGADFDIPHKHAQVARQHDAAEVRRIIESNNLLLAAAGVRGDAKAMSELYAEEGATLDFDGSHALGRKAIFNDLRQYFEHARATEVRYLTRNVVVIDDLAYERGEYRWVFNVAGKPRALEGIYVVIWRHDETSDKWQIWRDINTPLPYKFTP